MSIIKCKMCGGDIELSVDKTFGTCECCGSQMTFPKVSDEQRLALFNRGNAFRRAGEFDKALALYENIVREDDNDAEAHWCCALCRFGIEYVEDPATLEYIPTCHRASFDSFLDDVDYKAAVENTDGITKKQYQKDALKIADVQKGILATSQNEQPFDIFICYKETDDTTGQRTKDSIDAQEIYYHLTNEGYRVFFSRITLEDKAGTEYEPYIFAALNSAKVMIVLGSKPEYFNAVWVKNEWSRFLAMMRKDRSKLLLPCYRNMDPYDLPEQLSVLQSYDMTKIGFMQDLIHGIKKVTTTDEPKAAVKETVVVNNGGNGASNVNALIDRGFMALEDGEWEKADGFFEDALNQDAKNAQCYLGKLMAELSVKSKDTLKDCAQPFDDKNNCIKASKFSAEIAEKLNADNKFIRERNETERKQLIYNNAQTVMLKATTEDDYKTAASKFESISGFKDADEQKKLCLEKAEVARKDAIYDTAKGKMTGYFASGYTEAVKLFESIIDWKDSREKIDECNKKIENIRIAKEKAEAERKRKAEEAKAKKKKIAIIVTPIVAVVIVFLIVFNKVILPASDYKKALAAVDAGNYDTAYSLFRNNADYKDTQNQIKSAKEKQANELLAEGKYDEAYEILEAIGETDKINESNYNRAIELVESGDTDAAIYLFSQCVDYKDAKGKIKEIFNFKDIKAGDTIKFGSYYQSDSTNKEEIEWRVLEVKDGKALIISDKALDCVPYNEEYRAVTWETCTLRTWLNGTFLNEAFSAGEQTIIADTKVTADANPDYDTDPGNDTTDKVFLLSITEAEKYFSSNDDMMCKPTDYAVSNGAYVYDSTGACYWWLRSPGMYSYASAGVYSDVGVDYDGSYVHSDNACVRPAMWVEIG